MDRTDCVQSDVRAFGIAGDWKATASEEEVWVETVTEGWRRFTVARRRERQPAKRHQLAQYTRPRNAVRVRNGQRPA